MTTSHRVLYSGTTLPFQILDDGAHLARLNKQIADLKKALAEATTTAAAQPAQPAEAAAAAATAAELAQLRETEEKKIEMLQRLQNQGRRVTAVAGNLNFAQAE